MAAGTPNPILHVIVVGFHHKKGCQVEYCYPKLRKDGEEEEAMVGEVTLPSQWENLPSLALPDGAHNVEGDTVFFLLPSADGGRKSVYGVSCYRQISSKELKARSSEVTRSTVQKSVAVLATLPLFGPIKAKLEMITAAYFNEKDFGQVGVLADMYNNLAATISPDLIHTHALLGMIEYGLEDAAFYIPPVKKDSETPIHDPTQSESMEAIETMEEDEQGQEATASKITDSPNKTETTKTVKSTKKTETAEGVETKSPDNTPETMASENGNVQEASAPNASLDQDQEATPSLGQDEEASEERRLGKGMPGAERLFNASMDKISAFGSRLSAYWSEDKGDEAVELAEDALPLPPSYSTLNTDAFGFPLSIFTKGSLCHPYQSLPFLDTLASDTVRSAVFGATNALFLQRRNLVDAVVRLGILNDYHPVLECTPGSKVDEDGDLRVEIGSPELRRQVALTTADLRFAAFVTGAISPDTGDIFTDATSWEGGDEWIRLQFRSYLLSLIASTALRTPDKSTGLSAEEDFGPAFVAAWKTTHNYRVVSTGHYQDLANVPPGHPFAGEWTAADVKSKLNTLLETKEGKRLSSAVSGAGRLAASASSSLRSSFTAFMAPKDPPAP